MRRKPHEQLGFVEPLQALRANVGNDVCARVVFPILPSRSIHRRLDRAKPLEEILGYRSARRLHDSAAVGFPHRVAAGLPRLLFGAEAALGYPWVGTSRWFSLRTTKLVVPLRAASMYRAFHEATNSRSPAVTTYTRPP